MHALDLNCWCRSDRIRDASPNRSARSEDGCVRARLRVTNERTRDASHRRGRGPMHLGMVIDFSRIEGITFERDLEKRVYHGRVSSSITRGHRTWTAGEVFTVADATDLYEVDRWGKGYFS